MSVFFVKGCLVAVGAEKDVRHPVRGTPHLFTDCLQVSFRAAFDDQFVMDMADDETVGEGLHGMAKDIAADGLDDVLHELRTVAFYAFPFLCGTDAFVGDGFTAEFVFPDRRFHVGEHPSGGEQDEEHPALVKEMDAADFCPDMAGDGGLYGTVHIPPELCDMRVGCTPGIHQGLQVVFRKSHFQGTHGSQGTGGAAVSESQFRDLAFLAEMTVDAVFFHGHPEHLAGTGAVDVLSFREHPGPPGLTGKVGEDAGFDGRKVGNDEFVPVPGDEGCAYQLGKCVRDVFVQQFHRFIVTGADKVSGFREIRQVVLGEILQLYQASGPSSGPVRTIELEHPPGPAVMADRILHGLVFFYGRLGEPEAEAECVPDTAVCLGDQTGDIFFPEGFRLHTINGQPLFHLYHAVGVVQSGELFHGSSQGGPGSGIEGDRIFRHVHIQGDAPVVDLLVEMVFIPYLVRHRVP